ncbi:hypothetical protein ACA910_002278 [Epithemia clementina (nom. ined.)]
MGSKEQNREVEQPQTSFGLETDKLGLKTADAGQKPSSLSKSASEEFLKPQEEGIEAELIIVPSEDEDKDKDHRKGGNHTGRKPQNSDATVPLSRKHDASARSSSDKRIFKFMLSIAKRTKTRDHRRSKKASPAHDQALENENDNLTKEVQPFEVHVKNFSMNAKHSTKEDATQRNGGASITLSKEEATFACDQEGLRNQSEHLTKEVPHFKDPVKEFSMNAKHSTKEDAAQRNGGASITLSKEEATLACDQEGLGNQSEHLSKEVQHFKDPVKEFSMNAKHSTKEDAAQRNGGASIIFSKEKATLACDQEGLGNQSEHLTKEVQHFKDPVEKFSMNAKYLTKEYATQRNGGAAIKLSEESPVAEQETLASAYNSMKSTPETTPIGPKPKSNNRASKTSPKKFPSRSKLFRLRGGKRVLWKLLEIDSNVPDNAENQSLEGTQSSTSSDSINSKDTSSSYSSKTVDSIRTMEEDYLKKDASAVGPSPCDVDFTSTETWLAALDLFGMAEYLGGYECGDDGSSQATPIDAGFFADAIVDSAGDLVGPTQPMFRTLAPGNFVTTKKNPQNADAVSSEGEKKGAGNRIAIRNGDSFGNDKNTMNGIDQQQDVDSPLEAILANLITSNSGRFTTQSLDGDQQQNTQRTNRHHAMVEKSKQVKVTSSAEPILIMDHSVHTSAKEPFFVHHQGRQKGEHKSRPITAKEEPVKHSYIRSNSRNSGANVEPACFFIFTQHRKEGRLFSGGKYELLGRKYLARHFTSI